MPNSPEKVIREACIKANPAILDLTFGCVVRQRYHPATERVIEDEPDGLVALEVMTVGREDISEILGRPIRLADVLLAISEKEIFNSNMRGIAVNGGFYEQGVLKAQWNLKQDDLSLQSPETLEFLATLL